MAVVEWLVSLIRVLGATTPGAAALVQLSSELENKREGAKTDARLRRLEDPISSLHPDVQEVSALIYEQLSVGNASKVSLTDQQMDQFGRALAVLESEGMTRATHGLTKQYLDGFRVSNPTYVLYLHALYGESQPMEDLIVRIDQSPKGTWLRGNDIAPEVGLPLPVVRAVFELYEQRGFGMMSKELGTTNYYCRI